MINGRPGDQFMSHGHPNRIAVDDQIIRMLVMAATDDIGRRLMQQARGFQQQAMRGDSWCSAFHSADSRRDEIGYRAGRRGFVHPIFLPKTPAD